ncbi:hypothetical protein [Marinobacter fonticola]|uniref:hypothetical protein n=1 Tax=Marinobacter fonticola TaxID=2603215 RepID=UPI0011E85288|nr:hypothetical protein [Marinobacter fonticola]
MAEIDPRPPGHEDDISNVGPLVTAMLVTLGVIVACVFLVWWGFQAWQTPAEPTPFGDRPLSGRPQLQADPPKDLAVLEAQAQKRLQTVGWVDREAGVVHIPIDEAMALLLERGLPEPGISAEEAKLPGSEGAVNP